MKNYNNFLVETKQEKTAILTYGRMNPPTIGHVKLAKKIVSEARKRKAESFIFLSPTQNAKKDPLDPSRKVVYVEKTVGPHINIDVKPTLFEALSDLYSDGFRKIAIVVGSDRLSKFSKWVSQYNGIEGKSHGFYDFSDIDFVSSGDRDPDAEGAAGMSASKLRNFAVSGDFDSFKTGTKLSVKDTKSMYNEIRKAMKVETIKTEQTNLKESLRPGTEVKVMHPAAGKGMVSGKIVRYDKSGPGSPFYVVDIGELRSEKVPAHKIEEGKEFPKTKADKKSHLHKLFKKITNVNKRNKNSGYKIIDRIPKGYGPEEEAIPEGTRLQVKMALDDAGVKGEFKDGKVNVHKKHVKKAHKALKGNVYYKGKTPDVVGEDVILEKDQFSSQMIDKLKHQYEPWRGKKISLGRNVELEKIVRQFAKNKEALVQLVKADIPFISMNARLIMHQDHGVPLNKYEGVENPYDNLKKRPSRTMIRKMWANKAQQKKNKLLKPSHPGYSEEIIIDEMGHIVNISETKVQLAIEENLKKKAEQSGISFKILEKVYDRGVSSWKTGHKPGTTSQEWAESRVNSFLTGGKTRLIADEDLWTQVGSKHRVKEEMDTDHAFKKWLSISEGDVVVDTPQGRYVKKGSVAIAKIKAKRSFRDQIDKKAVSTRIATPLERKYLQRKDEE